MKKMLIRLISLFDQVCPKKNAVVLRGYPDVEDQCLSVLMALSRMQYQGRIVWIVKDGSFDFDGIRKKYGLTGLDLRILKNTDFRAVLAFVTSKFVLFTHGLYTQGDWGNYDPPRSKLVINLWHGMPIKSIWNYLPEPIEAPRAHALLATSGFYQKVMADLARVKKNDVWVTGLPRNDMLFFKKKRTARVISERIDSGEWYLYLPTYRRSKEGFMTSDGKEYDSVLNMSDVEASLLDDWLQSVDKKIVVKAHPMSVHAETSLGDIYKNIIILREDWFKRNLITLYEFAGYSSGLIADISSIIIDYLLLNRPIFIYFPDRSEYAGNRGFVFDDLDENLPGEICENVPVLIQQVSRVINGDDPGESSRKRLCEKFHALSSGLVTDELLGRMQIG